MIDRYEWLGRWAKRIPDDALVMSTIIGAVCYEWVALSEAHPRNCILSPMGFGIGLATGIALGIRTQAQLGLPRNGMSRYQRPHQDRPI